MTDTFTRKQVHDAVSTWCRCGGKPATDAGCCDACMVWHRLVSDQQQAECEHAKCLPAFDEAAANGMTVSEVRTQFPRFCGKCPDCGEQLIMYESFEHFIAGDW